MDQVVRAQKKTPAATGAQHQIPIQGFDMTIVPARAMPAYRGRGAEYARITPRTVPAIIRGGAQ